MDVTGVLAVDTKVANHLLQSVAAARLMGATVIVTGLSSEVSQTLVNLGVDLAGLQTIGDLQGGIEEAERLIGYEVSAVADGWTALGRLYIRRRDADVRSDPAARRTCSSRPSRSRKLTKSC